MSGGNFGCRFSVRMPSYPKATEGDFDADGRRCTRRRAAREGIQGVREHLHREGESRTQAHVNSWQAAMYRALAASDWYCGGGFAL